MKTILSSALLILTTSVGFAAPLAIDADASQLQVYPKNLARHHLGTNLLEFNDATRTYSPTRAAAAWLDDDVTTGFPPAPGKHFYILALSEPELLTNFCISARAATGTISLYASDTPAPPDAKSWTALAKNLNVEAINEKKLGKAFSRFAKYLLIETNLTDAGPWYSVYVYGQKPAVSYDIEKREKAIDPRALFGSDVNSQRDFSTSGLYANARVAYANSGEGFLAAQKAIDDNPESAVAVAPSTSTAGLVINYREPRAIERISVLAANNAKGKLEFFLIDQAERQTASSKATEGSNYLKVANTGAEKSEHSLTDMTPVATITLDGSNPRAGADFTATNASAMLVRWTPSEGSGSVMVREVESFGDLSLEKYAMRGSLEAIGENTGGDGKEMLSGKETLPPVGEGKEELPPVGEFLPNKAPFMPGPLSFPELPPLPPELPNSP